MIGWRWASNIYANSSTRITWHTDDRTSKCGVIAIAFLMVATSCDLFLRWPSIWITASSLFGLMRPLSTSGEAELTNYGSHAMNHFRLGCLIEDLQLLYTVHYFQEMAVSYMTLAIGPAWANLRILSQIRYSHTFLLVVQEPILTL